MTTSLSVLPDLVLSVTERWTHYPHFSMGKNFVLALVPFGLSLVLFRLKLPRYNFWWNCLWWMLALAFLLFLPNAAYVLTDIIHLIALLQTPPLLSL
jgi:uncharacterized membrane protein